MILINCTFCDSHVVQPGINLLPAYLMYLLPRVYYFPTFFCLLKKYLSLAKKKCSIAEEIIFHHRGCEVDEDVLPLLASQYNTVENPLVLTVYLAGTQISKCRN